MWLARKFGLNGRPTLCCSGHAPAALTAEHHVGRTRHVHHNDDPAGSPRLQWIAYGGRMIVRLTVIRLASAVALLFPAGPLTAEEQPARKIPVVAVVSAASPASEQIGPDPINPAIRAFVHALRDAGWVEGRNIVIERRSGEGQQERLPAIFAELVARNVDVIAVSGAIGRTSLTQEAHRATRKIPIVMAVGPSDPVAEGHVASLARPGGNVTGLTRAPDHGMREKRLQLLKEIVPGIARVASLGPRPCLESFRRAAEVLGIALVLAEVERIDQYAGAFATVTRERADGLFVCDTALSYVHAPRITAFAAQHRLPSVYAFRESVEAGGLVSYGSDLVDLFRRAAGYVDRILRGAKPADLPVEQPTKFELVINLKTAKELGLKVPPSLLLRADHVIE